jgi:hypothetical protein
MQLLDWAAMRACAWVRACRGCQDCSISSMQHEAARAMPWHCAPCPCQVTCPPLTTLCALPPAALFDDLVSGHQLAEAAAGECIARLRDWLGARILAGRLTEEQQRLLATNANIPPPAVAGAYQQRIMLYGQPLSASALLGHLQMSAPLPGV